MTLSVLIIDIGEGQCRHEGLVFGDDTIGYVLVHELATSSEARGRDVRPIHQDIFRPLVMNLVRPTSLEQVRKSKLHQQVAERGRVQDARIVLASVFHVGQEGDIRDEPQTAA